MVAETTHRRISPSSRPHWIMPDGNELTSLPVEAKERPFVYSRMLRRLPATVRNALTEEQLDAISDALIPDPPTHAVDYRVSIPFFGKRFYITLLAGRERRSLERLAREAQLHAKHIALFYSVMLMVLACISFIGLVLISYVVKSALDVDVMDGPSFLHRYFYEETAAEPVTQLSSLRVQIPKT